MLNMQVVAKSHASLQPAAKSAVLYNHTSKRFLLVKRRNWLYHSRPAPVSRSSASARGLRRGASDFLDGNHAPRKLHRQVRPH